MSKQRAPAKREQMRLEISNIQKTDLGKPISRCTEEEVKQPIRYAMMAVGIKEENMPSVEEKAVLLKFIKSNYPDFTPDEIRFAFEKAMAREFKDVDVNCYQNFSCEYIGRILFAYKKWKPADHTAFRYCSLDDPKIKEGINEAYARFLGGERNEFYSPWFYRQMVQDNLITRIKGPFELRFYPMQIAVRKAFIEHAEAGHTNLYDDD